MAHLRWKHWCRWPYRVLKPQKISPNARLQKTNERLPLGTKSFFLVGKIPVNFCFPKEKKRSTASIGEAVIKCARSSSSHQFIEDWHKKMFDLGKDQVESIIGKYSK